MLCIYEVICIRTCTGIHKRMIEYTTGVINLKLITPFCALHWQQAKVRILRKFRICIIRKSGNRCDNIMAGREEMNLKRQASAPLYEAIERLRKKE